MENSLILTIFLVTSGILLTFIGAAFLFMPKKMKANQGIKIAGDVSMLNETRSASTLILVFALLILFGAFESGLSYIATLVSVLMLLSLGVGRLMSIVIDGIPVKALVIATIVELVMGIIGAIMLIVYKV